MRMSINISAMMDEYTQFSFELWGAWHVVQPAGHQSSFRTAASAFIFPVRGEAFFLLDKKQISFEPGRMIHCCKGKWLEAGNIGDSEAEYYLLVYRPLAAAEQAPYMHSAFDTEIGQNPRLFALLKQLSKIVGKPDSNSKFQAKAMVYSILSEMFISMQGMEKTESHSVVLEAKEYMDIHYMESCAVSNLSERYGMDAKYFSEVFKKYTGVSPMDYLIGLRMNHAHRLLMSTSCTIKEIGNSIGYGDPYYFSRLFKKKFGVAPTEFRKSSRGKS